MSYTQTYVSTALFFICLALFSASINANEDESELSVGILFELETQRYVDIDSDLDVLPYIKYRSEHIFIEGLEFGVFLYEHKEWSIDLFFNINNEGYENKKAVGHFCILMLGSAFLHQKRKEQSIGFAN